MQDIQPKKAPALNLPSGQTCTVSIINTTTELTVPENFLTEPYIPGKDWLNLPDFAFLIENNKTHEKVIFDLGTRADFWNSVPAIADLCENHVPGLRVEKDVTTILEEGGVSLSALKSLILSHWHFDHNGNISSLPRSVDLIVGPGFREAFAPGYPAKKDSVFWEADFHGRNVVEAPFHMKIGKFDAWDYLGDGSIYVLNVPGHAVGHVSALVRTTPDTFVFLGGDVCHFCGDIRPTEYIPMPDPLPDTALLDKRFQRPCPCSIFTACHPDKDASRNTPFYKCASGSASFYFDPPTAMESIRSLMEFDADPNVLTLIAHDPAPLETMTFFPNGNINEWKQKGLKEAMHWYFLNEMPAKGVKDRPVLVDGLYRDGKKVKDLKGQQV